MVPHTQNPDDKVSYGGLLAVAIEATATAQLQMASPFRDARQAADLLVDFERFLSIGGRHLALLVAPPSTRGSGIRQAHHDAAHRLSELAMERRGDTLWADAGDWLGLAHDTLSTHLSPTGQLRTSEVEALLEAGVQAAAVNRIIALVEGPLESAQELVTRVRGMQPRREPHLGHNRAFRLRQAVHSARWSLAGVAPLPVAAVDATTAVDRLRPALTTVCPVIVPGDGLGALRLLRQLSYRQSQGEEPANAHTLTDLCGLGAATTRATQVLLPLAHTPLERVHRANTVDQLSAAEASWTRLGRHLFPRVQGLAKAPTLYRDVISAVTSDATRQPAVTAAVLAALPRLAIDASRTVSRLQEHGELVWCGRRPGELIRRWQPLDGTQAQGLINDFAAVSGLSHSAYELWRHSPGGSAEERLSQPAAARKRGLQLDATS